MIKTVSMSKALKGEIIIPPDKSISHRAIMLSSLAKGKSIIKNFLNSADCISTLNIFKALGISAKFIDENMLEVVGGNLQPQSLDKIYNCGNSGTTMRLISGILAGQDFDSILAGDESLSKRPMKRIIDPLRLMGADITSLDGKAPLCIRGNKLYGINYDSPISSAQVKSCILLAGINPRTQGNTTYTELAQSRNHTELMLKYMGANIISKNLTTAVEASELVPKTLDIVGDISSAAFFIVAGLIVKSSDIILKNVGINSTRVGILDVVKRMGGNIEILNKVEKSGEISADIRVKYTDSLKGCIISGADIPRLIDEIPIIAVLASQADGETIVKDAEDLRNKESDRITCLVEELQKIGVDIFEQKDGFVIHGNSSKNLVGDAKLYTYHDHRLAMSFYIAGLICEKEIYIDGFEWTEISFPQFEKLINKLSTSD